jgi:metal-sulfur cluster biosynthetic enzyme
MNTGTDFFRVLGPLEFIGGFPVTKQDILRVLDHILDPDLKDRSIVEMGFVREDDIELQEEEIRVSYTVGGPLCPYSAAVGIIIHYTLHERFKKHIKVRMKEGHYQEELVNQILGDEAQYEVWLEKIKSQNLLSACLRA